jgi:hypothetical protein
LAVSRTCFIRDVPDAMIDTAAQRAATGLDEGARKLLLGVVREAGLGPKEIVAVFFRDRFGGPEDYLDGVGNVWGEAEGFRLRQAVGGAQTDAEMAIGFGERRNPQNAASLALLLHCPEPDFRLAISEALRAAQRMEEAAERISRICRDRGAPWAFAAPAGFEYVGDEDVEQKLIRPALAAINRPEFSGGVRAELEAARGELAKGAPGELKQAVHEAGCSVESAMKVVLEKHGVGYGNGDTALPLFQKLEGAGLVPRDLENLVLVAMTPRNRRAGHGAGAQAHRVSAGEAEAIVSGAAGAIAYLATVLP